MRREQWLPWLDCGTPRAHSYFMSVEMFQWASTTTVCTAGGVIDPKPVHASPELAHAVSWAAISRARLSVAPFLPFAPNPPSLSSWKFFTALMLRLYGPHGLCRPWVFQLASVVCLSRGGMWRRWFVEGGCMAYRSWSFYQLRRLGDMAMGGR